MRIMNDSLFIDSDLPINFWAKTMDMVNYLYNRLLIKRGRPFFIVRGVSIFMLSEKHTKSDMDKA